MDEDLVRFEVDVDAAHLDGARAALASAMILQNARVARRFDPVSPWRTPTMERRLRAVGLGASGIGGVLSLFLAVVTGWDVVQGLFVVFVALLLLFGFIEPVRKKVLDCIDGFIVWRATRLLRPVAARVPATVAYEVTDTALVGVWSKDGEGVSRWSRDLSSLRYALVGEGIVVLFRHPRSQNPSAMVFSVDAGLQEALTTAGVEVVALSPALLSPTGSTRRWPAGG